MFLVTCSYIQYKHVCISFPLSLTASTAHSISVPARSASTASTNATSPIHATLETPEAVYAFWKDIATAAWFSPDQECVTSILLNRRSAVIGWNLVSLGTS
jgi:hypothetical protein